MACWLVLSRDPRASCLPPGVLLNARCSSQEELDEACAAAVFQEQVDGKNLTDIINTEHENVKYLPVRRRVPTARARATAVATAHAALVASFHS